AVLFAAGILAGGHVFNGKQDALPGMFIAGQHDALELDIKPLALERIVDGIAGKGVAALPELHHLFDMRVQHVVAEHAFKIGHQMVDAIGLEERKRLAIDLENADMAGADAQPGRVLMQEGPEIGNAKRTPFLELLAQAAIVLKPQGDWGEVKNIGAVAQGRLDIHGFRSNFLPKHVSRWKAVSQCPGCVVRPIGKSRDGYWEGLILRLSWID